MSGGEPIIKSNIVSICRRIAEIEGISELCLTTNGMLLPSLAGESTAITQETNNKRP